jgi:6-methylsalicylate decarboxylase
VCHGTDRPYAGPVPLPFGEAAEHAIRTANPMRLLAAVPEAVPA